MKKLLAKILGRDRLCPKHSDIPNEASQKLLPAFDSVVMLVTIPDDKLFASVVEHLCFYTELYTTLGFRVQVQQWLKPSCDNAQVIHQYYRKGQLKHQKVLRIQSVVVSETRTVVQDVSHLESSTVPNDANLHPVLSQKGADTYPYADPYIKNINKAIILNQIQQNLKL